MNQSTEIKIRLPETFAKQLCLVSATLGMEKAVIVRKSLRKALNCHGYNPDVIQKLTAKYRRKFKRRQKSVVFTFDLPDYLITDVCAIRAIVWDRLQSLKLPDVKLQIAEEDKKHLNSMKE